MRSPARNLSVGLKRLPVAVAAMQLEGQINFPSMR
jgi:hypothetical protein